MTTKSRTTHSRARKKTVAEETETDAAQDQVVPAESVETSEPKPEVRVEDSSGDIAEEPERTTVDVEPSSVVTPADLAPDKGKCVNHPDRAAVLVATRGDFPWLVHTQRFCNQCIPASYRHLL